MALRKANPKRPLSSLRQFSRRKKRKNYKKKSYYEKHETTINLLYTKENNDLLNMINSTKRILERLL